MDQPLGRNVGNILEVIEAVEALKGNMELDVKKVVLELGSVMLKMAGKGENLEENRMHMLENISNGKALKKFKELIQNQGGDVSYIENLEKFEKAKYIIPVKSKKMGVVTKLPAEEIGKFSVYLGAGRIKKEDNIDYTAGIELNKKISDRVNLGEVIAIIHTNDKEKAKEAENKIQEIYEIE